MDGDGHIATQYWLQVQSFDFFHQLVRLLCWADMEALLQAYPELTCGFTNAMMRRMGDLCRPRLRQLFRFSPGVELPDRLALWHWSTHSRRMERPPHLVYDRPCDAPRRTIALPHQRPKHYRACSFLPSEAPEPFAGALVVISDTPRTANVYAVDDQGFYLCVEDLCSFDSDRIVVSPRGHAFLLVAESTGEVIVVLLGKYKLDRIVSRVTTTGVLGKSWFLSEDEFVLSDANYDLYRYTVRRDILALEKVMIHAPELCCSVVYDRAIGKRATTAGSPRMGMPHSLLRYGCGKDFIVIEDRCGREWHHPTHAFQLVLEPGLDRDSRVFRCSFAKHCLIELAVDHSRGLIYVVCLTTIAEDEFYRLHLCLDRRGRRPPTCNLDFPEYRNCSLCVYTIEAEDVPVKRSLIPLVPTFYVPSMVVEANEAYDISEAHFFRAFSTYQLKHLAVSLSDLFLVVRHSSCTLLLFPRLAVPGTLPLSVTFSGEFAHYSFSPGNVHLCCLPAGKGLQVASAAKVHAICSHRARAEDRPNNKKSTRYNRVLKLMAKSDFF